MIEKAFVKCQLGKNLFWYSTNSFLTLTGNHKQTIKTKSIITVVIVMQQIIFGPKVKKYWTSYTAEIEDIFIHVSTKRV